MISLLNRTKEKPHMREILLKSEFQIQVDDILEEWAAEWNETGETCSERWKLKAFPVLADGTVALLLEHTVNFYEGAIEDQQEYVIQNDYRVLVYDPKKKKCVGRYRFHLFRGFAKTVFFKNGCLYALVANLEEGREGEFTALHMWPGSDDAHQIHLGGKINCAAAKSNGDIIVSYEEDAILVADEGEFAGGFFQAEGEIRGIPCFPDVGSGRMRGITHVTLDSKERMWALLYDRHTVVCMETGDRCAKYRIPGMEAEAIALPDEEKGLFAMAAESSGYTLNYLPMNGQTLEEKETRCAVRTKAGRIGCFADFTVNKSTAALLADGTIYVVDLKCRPLSLHGRIR